MPLMAKPPSGFAIILEAEYERAALQELASELAKSWVDEVEDAFPDGGTGLSITLKPADRLAKYLNITPEEDIQLFMVGDYVNLARNDLMRMPTAEYWQRLITELPRTAERNIQDFLRLLRTSEVE